MAAANPDDTSTKRPDDGPRMDPPLVNRRVHVLLALAATAALMVFGFPDGDQDYLAWVAVVPLFLVARGAGGKRGFFRGWLAGLLIEAFGFGWILYSIQTFTGFRGYLSFVPFLMFFAWLAYSSLSWAILGWLLGRCRTAARIHWVIPIWVGVEYYFPRIFPWHFGGALYEREWLRQGADIFGASGLSYVILLVNAVVYLAIEWRRGRAGRPSRSAAVAAGLLLALTIYGAWRYRSLQASQEGAPQVRVGMIQPFLLPDEKRERVAFFDLMNTTMKMIEEAEAQGKPLGLVLWPEGTAPVLLVNQPGVDPLRGYGNSFDRITVPILIGGMSGNERSERWNTAAYILPKERKGNGPRVQLYHKNIRLLFGEWVPFQQYMPEWIRSRVAVGTIEAGTDSPIFQLEIGAGTPQRFRTLICYEAVLPGFVRSQSGGIDFFVNVTEDIWYGPTSHIRQHESVLRMRCVENRIPMVRCTNVGPSGFVDAAGDFDQRTPAWQRVDGGYVVTLRPGGFFSLYRAGGSLFPLVALLFGLTFAHFHRGRRGFLLRLSV